MRLSFLTNFFPPHDLGGMEQLCEEIAARLQGRGHEVAILTSRYGDLSKPENKSFNVDRALYLESDNNYYRVSDFFFRRSIHERENKETLHRHIQQFSPDVLMVWGMWNLSRNLPYWAEYWMAGRVAYFLASYWPKDLDPHTSYWRLPTNNPLMEIFKKPFRSYALTKLRRERYPPVLKFEHASCCSAYVRDTLVNANMLPPTSKVLFVGIDPKPYLEHARSFENQGDGSLRLLYFGRLIHDKGVHTAIAALSNLKQRGLAEDINLTILGSGHPEYESELHQMVDHMELSGQVQFIKKVPRHEIPQYLGQFDIFLFTSIWPEPMARSVMEAMAAGLLVIGTEVGGQVEMLTNGVNGLTFNAEDANGLADHLASIKKDPALRLKLACSGQETVLNKFTLDRMVAEIEQNLLIIGRGAPVV